jgi:hypothetical protein
MWNCFLTCWLTARPVQSVRHGLIGDSWTIIDIPEPVFGVEVRTAMTVRLAFLNRGRFTESRAGKVILRRSLLASLRSRELTQVASALQAETGLKYRPVADQQRVRGVYRRSPTLASGGFALREDGAGFSLVPWRPIIEQRLGQTVVGRVQGSNVSGSWDGRSDQRFNNAMLAYLGYREAFRTA